jgi:hypothetical protein
MTGRWITRMAAVVAVVLTADAAFAAQNTPGWTTSIQAGSAVRVTMKKTDEAFDAIWMGRDGDRAVFERFDPRETISVPIDSVRRVRMRKGSSSPNAGAMGALGAVAGVFGAFAVIALILRGT